METKDNNVAKKTNDLRNDLDVEKQPKDPRDDLEVVKRGIGPISDPNFDDDLLEKSSIVFKPFNLRIKIPENIFYIVIKSGIHIYSKDL